MKKALFIVSDANYRGGTEILAFNLLNELNKNGVECLLLSIYRYHGHHPSVISFTEKDFGKWQFINKHPLNKLSGNCFSDWFLKRLVSKYVKAYNIDWVINHTYDLIGAIPHLENVRTAQIFNWSIDGYEDSLRSKLHQKSWIAFWASKITLENSIRRWHQAIPKLTKLVVLTDAAKYELKTINPKVKAQQLVTIPDPIMNHRDADVLSPLNTKNIVFVGRLSSEKGVMRLLRIWEKISPKVPDYTLRIYGEGYARAEMQAYIAKNKIQNVEFMGFCSELSAIYLNADLCCMTSDTEGFGMVLIESMYYGVPCISFDCPISPKEIIADAGFTVPCFDEDVYANKIVEYLHSPDQKQALQKAAVKRAAHFYIDNILRSWMSLLS